MDFRHRRLFFFILYFIVFNISAFANVPCGVIDLTDTKNSAALRKSSAAPSVPFQSYLSPEGHFEIFYVNESYEAVPQSRSLDGKTPDFVLLASATLEHAWSLLMDTLAYPAPKSCGDGRANRYRVELREPGAVMDDFSGAYGLTIQCKKGRSYMVVENDFKKYVKGRYYDFITLAPDGRSLINYADNAESWQAALEVTTVHELFHAVQFSMTASIQGFWTEASAVWIENRAYPENNDYMQYLRHALHHPEAGLLYVAGGNESDLALHHYAEGIWGEHLSHWFGDSIIKESWTDLALKRSDINDLFPNLLRRHNSSISEIFTRFALAQFFSGARFNEKFTSFEDARFFPSLALGDTLAIAEPKKINLAPLAFVVLPLASTPTEKVMAELKAQFPKGSQISFLVIQSPTSTALATSLAQSDSDRKSLSVLSLVENPQNSDLALSYFSPDPTLSPYLMVTNTDARRSVSLTVTLSESKISGSLLESQSLPFEGSYGTRRFKQTFQVFPVQNNQLNLPQSAGSSLWMWSNAHQVWEPSETVLAKWAKNDIDEVTYLAVEESLQAEDQEKGGTVGGGVYVKRFRGSQAWPKDGIQSLIQKGHLGFRSFDLMGRKILESPLNNFSKAVSRPDRIIELRYLTD